MHVKMVGLTGSRALNRLKNIATDNSRKNTETLLSGETTSCTFPSRNVEDKFKYSRFVYYFQVEMNPTLYYTLAVVSAFPVFLGEFFKRNVICLFTYFGKITCLFCSCSILLCYLDCLGIIHQQLTGKAKKKPPLTTSRHIAVSYTHLTLPTIYSV